MLFPQTGRVEYSNNPLEEVICQVRFPPILKIGANSPAEFQDHIRKLFPLYEEQSDGGISLPNQVREMLSEAGIEGLFPTQTPRLHRFSTEDASRSVSLQSDFIAFAVNDYKRWQDFREQFGLIERKFRCLYEPSFYSRIGLRYRDVITRKNLGLERYSWGDLLNRDLVGLLGDEEVSSRAGQAVTVIQMRLPDIEGAQLTLRYGLLPHPDQDPLDSYAIDTDIFIEQRVEPNDCFRLLDKFNGITGNIFRWAISDILRDALGPNPI